MKTSNAFRNWALVLALGMGSLSGLGWADSHGNGDSEDPSAIVSEIEERAKEEQYQFQRNEQKRIALANELDSLKEEMRDSDSKEKEEIDAIIKQLRTRGQLTQQQQEKILALLDRQEDKQRPQNTPEPIVNTLRLRLNQMPSPSSKDPRTKNTSQGETNGTIFRSDRP